MKKCLLALSVAVLISAAGFTQVTGGDYKAGIGLRLGGGYYDLVAASLKVFPRVQSAFEFNLGIKPWGLYTSYGRHTFVSASASYQHHFPISNIEGFKWFIGGGLTAYNSFSSDEDVRGVGLAIFPTGGVEYKFPEIPLAVSADLRPSVSLFDTFDKRFKKYNDFYFGNFGIAARYTFR